MTAMNLTTTPRADRTGVAGWPWLNALPHAMLWTMDAFVLGLGLGFFVALQLGPMSLFLVRSTLRNGWAVGAAIAAGIAAVDALYAACGAAGAAALLTVDAVRVALGLAGAAVLVLLGVHTLVG